MRDHIWQRVVDIGNYILRSRATVRDTAKVFGVSKSTVHKDVTERLPKVNAKLADEVKKVLEFNKAERHLRGGEATRQKFRREPGDARNPAHHRSNEAVDQAGQDSARRNRSATGGFRSRN